MTRKYLGTGYNMGNQRILAVADPQAATDAVNLQSAQRLIAGVTSRKEAVRVASTTNVTVASPGTAIDGVTLTTGDRVLLKDQSTGSQNGIYDFNGSAVAMTRSADADTDPEVKPGTQVFVSEGTVNGNTTWQITTDGPIIVGTTALVWAQTAAGGTTYAAGNGLTLASNTFSVNPASGGGLAVSASGVALASGVAGNGLTLTSGVLSLASTVPGNGLTMTSGVINVVGGTGITVAADLVSVDTAVVVRKYAVNVGNASSTSIAVTHSLGTRDITYSVQDATTFEFVEVDGVATDANTLTLTFATAPASNAYRVTVHG
jgi:phage-related tail fiber protein